MKTFLYHEDYPAGLIFESETEVKEALKEGWKDAPPHMWEPKPVEKEEAPAKRGRPPKKNKAPKM